MRVKKINMNSSELYMSSEFIMKGGPLGWLMGALLMSPMMKGFAYHAATGERVDEKPISDEQLANIITAKQRLPNGSDIKRFAHCRRTRIVVSVFTDHSNKFWIAT